MVSQKNKRSYPILFFLICDLKMFHLLQDEI
jgi:hypothetical protein